MEMSKIVALIVGITVSIVIFVSVLVPIINDYTQVDTDPSTEGVQPVIGDPTWATLIVVCGTLTIIAILMIVVRSLSNKMD